MTRRPRPAILALLVPLVAGFACEREAPDGREAPEVCLRYVDCVQVVDAKAGAEAEARYGAQGSCWGGDEVAAAGCLALCDEHLRGHAAMSPEVAACDAAGIESDVEFEIGEAVIDPEDPFGPPTYRALAGGDTLPIVRGGQGLLMLAFALRGRNFVITEDPNDWGNPRMPKVDMWVDIDGHNVGFGGHFARLDDFAVGFYPLADGTLEHMYVAIIVPDAIEDPQTLTGQAGKVHIELSTFNEPAAIRELNFVVAPEIQGF